MPTATALGAPVPGSSDPEDDSIHAEQLAYLRDQLADVHQQRQHVAAQMQALHDQCLVADFGSAEWHGLVHAYHALCATRTPLRHAWHYWTDEYFACLLQQRQHRLDAG